MDSLEVALSKHAPWYDSFDQGSDSWGCLCDRVARYRTREEVVAQHIAPLIRNVVQATTERMEDVQNKLRASATRGVWDDVPRLINYCRTHQMPNLAGAFESYEDERQRQDRAIKNLEDQLTAVSDAYRKGNADHKKLTEILKSMDIDPDVLIMTDEIFNPKPKSDNRIYPSGTKVKHPKP